MSEPERQAREIADSLSWRSGSDLLDHRFTVDKALAAPAEVSQAKACDYVSCAAAKPFDDHSVVFDFKFFSGLSSLSVKRTQNDHRNVSLTTFATKTLTPLRSTTSVVS
jgi:hypothetical protein